MKKKTTLVAVPLLAATIVGLGLYGVSSAYAEDGVVNEFMHRFERTEAEREEHRQEREAAFEEKMTEAVENGTLNQEQVTAIEAKHEELKTKRDAIWKKDLSREERREAMHEIRDEMRNWIEEQGLEDVMPKPENGMRRGGGNGGLRF